jgi:hypothetical protein
VDAEAVASQTIPLSQDTRESFTVGEEETGKQYTTTLAPSALAARATRARKSSGTPAGMLPLATKNVGAGRICATAARHWTHSSLVSLVKVTMAMLLACSLKVRDGAAMTPETMPVTFPPLTTGTRLQCR